MGFYRTFAKDLNYNKDAGIYEVGLPWKPCHLLLPDNYSNSLGRLATNIRSLKRNPAKLKQYHDVIVHQHEDGTIEKCSKDNPDLIIGEVHYLPHRAVVRGTSTSTNLRIVHDASSKPDKTLPSLNECLLKGPSLNPLIIDLLLRFRLHHSAFICDIKKAFLQIRIKESDRNALRFLWVEDPFSDNLEIIIYRFTRVLFGLNCSPFLLNGTLREHFLKYTDNYSEAIAAFIRSIYVDDYVGGADCTGNAYERFILLAQILREGGFEVHKFLSNNENLLKLVERNCDLQDNSAITSETFSSETLGCNSTIHKVLGIPWCHKADLLFIEFETCLPETQKCKPSKRLILTTVAKNYDPLGYASPVTMYLKLIFQETCQHKLQWDEELNEDLKKRWVKWIEDCIRYKRFLIPRRYVTDGVGKTTLVGFCDASTKGYAAVIYLRHETLSGDVQTMLLGSKTKQCQGLNFWDVSF